MGKTDLEQRYKSGHFSIQVQPDLIWKETKGTDSAINQASQGTWQMAKVTRQHTRYGVQQEDTSNENVEQMEQREQLGTEGRMGSAKARGENGKKRSLFWKN